MYTATQVLAPAGSSGSLHRHLRQSFLTTPHLALLDRLDPFSLSRLTNNIPPLPNSSESEPHLHASEYQPESICSLYNRGESGFLSFFLALFNGSYSLLFFFLLLFLLFFLALLLLLFRTVLTSNSRSSSFPNLLPG